MEGIKKTFTVTGSKGVSARVTVMEEYDISANTSRVTVGVALACSTYYGYTYYLDGTVSAGGQTLQVMDSYDGTHNVTIGKLDTYVTVAGNGHPGSPWISQPIAHDTDGSKTITVAVNIKGYEAAGRGANGFKVTGSRSVTLTHIPRASTALAADTLIGSVAIIAVSRKSTDYTHTIGYTFGDLGGYIAADGTVSGEAVRFSEVAVPFLIPEAFYGQIPNAPSALCELSCTTYLGDTQIGEIQHSTFTVTAAENLCAPLVSGWVRDENPDTLALTGDDQVLVQYMSHVLCGITAQSRYGATVGALAVNSQQVEGETIVLPAAGEYRFTATDSRGYTGSFLLENTLIPYVPLTCQCTVVREDPTSGRGILTVTGEAYAGSFGAVENQLVLRCRVGNGPWQEVTPQFQEHTYTATAALTGLEYDRRTTVTVEAADCLMQQTAAVTVEKGIPVFDWGEEDFRFRVPVYLEYGLYDGAGKVPYAAANRKVNGYPLTEDVQLAAVDVGAMEAQESEEYAGCYYRMAGQEQEWINPPMVAGVEYRTAQRWEGMPVYVQRIHISSLPNDGVSNIPLELPASQILRCDNVICTDNGYLVQSPYFTASGTLLIKHLFTGNHLQISTTSDYRGAVANFTVFYVKEAIYV